MRRVMRDKRKWLDYIITVPATVLCAPVLVGIAIWVKLDSPGPVFFRQKRVGIHQNYFEILKFRTMRTDTPENVPTHLLEHPEQYITKSGKFLRATSLDELPQLFNILKGDMSIIGPRPALPREVAQYGEFDKLRLLVKPGLSCYWQISGRSDIPFDEWMKLDVKYIREMNLLTDIKIILLTFPAVIKGDGAY